MPTDGARADLLITHGTVVTVDRQRRIFADGAVAVLDREIIAVGPTAELMNTWSAARTLDAAGGLVQPGFVDAHVHASQHLGRGTLPDSWSDDREHELWLPYVTRLSAEDEYHATLLAGMEMVRNGTTMCCDLGGNHPGELRAEALDRVGVRGMLCDTVWDLPPFPEVATGGVDECLARLERLVEALPRTSSSRVWGGVGLPGMGYCSDELVTSAKALADQHGLVLYMHQSFGPDDVAAYARLSGGRPAVEHLADLGVLGPGLQLVHLIRTTPSEVDLLACTNTNVVHCPAASLRVGMGVSVVGRIPEMVAGGVPVALGSDAGNFSDAFDVARQAYLAATIHREARREVPVLTCEQALEMATINGAVALGVGDRVGSLEVGKQADIVVHSAQRPEWHPALDPVAALVYSAQSRAVDTVVVDGEIVLEGGEFPRLDELDVYTAIDRSARALHERMHAAVASRWPVV